MNFNFLDARYFWISIILLDFVLGHKLLLGNNLIFLCSAYKIGGQKQSSAEFRANYAPLLRQIAITYFLAPFKP